MKEQIQTFGIKCIELGVRTQVDVKREAARQQYLPQENWIDMLHKYRNHGWILTTKKQQTPNPTPLQTALGLNYIAGGYGAFSRPDKIGGFGTNKKAECLTEEDQKIRYNENGQT